MAKSSRQDNARLAELRAQQARQDRSRRMMLAGAVLAVIVLIAGGIFWAAKSNSDKAIASAKTSGAVSSVLSGAMQGIPTATFDTIGAGTATVSAKGQNGQTVKVITPVTGADPLTKDGKPEVLYIGAEYCPYCASERWALVAALERFGTFTGLDYAMSSPTDVNPNTPTVSFKDATYTSDYLSFVSYEIQDRNGQPLQTLPDDVSALSKKYGSGSIPWIDYGGKATQSGSSVDGALLAGKSQDEIAQALADPNSDIAKSVDGGANLISAQLCQLTGNKPDNVCTSPGVMAAATKSQQAG